MILAPVLKEEVAPNVLPAEFSLYLGPRSVEQLAALARALRDRGAEVSLGEEGSLVAVRPQ